jgi:hypothetical protein
MADAPPGEKVRGRLAAAEKAVGQAMELTSLLITFSRGGEPVREVVDIGEMLKDAVSKNIGEWPVERKFQLAPDLWVLEIDERQIRQVIRSLAINAVEAMPEGGTLTVRAENTRVTAQDGLPIAEGPYVRISMEDTGTGIPREELPLIFDPYFSTKQRGPEKGRGSACRSVTPWSAGTTAASPWSRSRGKGPRSTCTPGGRQSQHLRSANRRRMKPEAGKAAFRRRTTGPRSAARRRRRNAGP